MYMASIYYIFIFYTDNRYITLNINKKNILNKSHNNNYSKLCQKDTLSNSSLYIINNMILIYIFKWYLEGLHLSIVHSFISFFQS